MKKHTNAVSGIFAATLLACSGAAPAPEDDQAPVGKVAEDLNARVKRLSNDVPFRNGSGFLATFSTRGYVDLTNEFFQDLGTNGRTCESCHRPEEGWTITPAGVRERFERTGGTDPIFRINDGSNSPNADVSSMEARRETYGMLLTRGVIRIGIGVPRDAEFELVAVDDPYGYASASELSLFRRPLPSTNLAALSTVMWDGRETLPSQSIGFDLSDQANGATLGHAQAAAPLTAAQRESIVDFETGLFTAQVYDDDAGILFAHHAGGGPKRLSFETTYIGINDLFGDSRTGAPFNPVVFDTYDAWNGSHSAHREAIARGQKVFNTKPIVIRGVSGINDEAAFGSPEAVTGTCTTCHDSPNFGNHSVPSPLNIGIADASRRTPDMPLYTLRNKTTGETVQTTDPGRGLISGKWKHIGRFKGPILRGLAARAPYFHNGAAKDIAAVIGFYETRFGIDFTDEERADLAAFLRAL
jgi:hypothetical protein